MKSIKDVLSILVAIAAAIFAIYQFYLFETFKSNGVTDVQGGTNHLWLAIAVVAVVAGIIYFTGHVNKEEEIHITQ
jgi:hypothetical protein